MNIRPKTFRRLLILFGASSVLAGVLICVVVAGVYRNAREMKRIRAQAMTAYKEGNYVKSVELFQTYRDMAGVTDPDAEFAYGVSRVHVELPDGKHLVEGIHVFEQYLQSLKPGDAAAERQLLQLYVARGYFTEAIHLADDLLSANPRDGQALHEKVLALAGQHQTQSALEVNQKLNAIEPLNIHGQIVTIMLLAQLNTPPEQVIAYAQALQKAHENDPRFEMLLAFAYSQEKQDESAKKWLLQAARGTPPDAQFVADLAVHLDEEGLFVESGALLERSADLIADVAVQRMLAERLWEDGNTASLLERLKNQTPQSPSSDGVLMAYRALALYSDLKTGDGDALARALALRTDAPSVAWAMALQARYAKAPLSASELASRLATAVARDPENPVLHEMLAEVYLRMNESELVIQQCALASQHAKSWAAPYLMTAEAQTITGRHAEAVESARLALDRAPSRYETRLMRAKTFFAWASDSGVASNYVNLLTYLEQMQRTYHDAQTLPMYVAVLARTGHREQALKAVDEAMKADPPLPMETLAQLAETCDSENLGMGAEVRDIARKTQGVTPEISLSQARAMLRAGHGAQGLEFILNAARGREKEIAWRIAVALYREAFGQPDALKDWISLGDQYPGDLRLQQTILRAQSRTRDRAFWARTIERVKAITGEQGLLWRMERSRWLLAGPLSERDKAEAVNLLTQVTAASPGLAEPHRLLALAMEKVNNVPGALAELTTAAETHRGDLTITRELVRLLTASDRNAEALEYLDKLAQSRELTIQARHWLAQTYAERGYNQKAIALLTAETAVAPQDGRPVLPNSTSAEAERLLVGVYAGAGDFARAEQAARLWGQYAPAQAMNADIARAEVDLLQPVKNPSAALEALEPYVASATATYHSKVIELYARALVSDDRTADAAAMLAPLLAVSPRWRAVWLDLGAWQKDFASGSAWIRRAVPFIAANAPGERCALAKAWYAVGSKFETPAALDAAAEILQPLTSGGDDIPEAWILTAMTAQARFDYDTAERAYRHVLKKDPTSPDCLNNLAYLLWLRDRPADLPEARRLAESAVALRPNDASFYDTLARIQARAGDIGSANRTFRVALQKDPNSLEAMIGQAELLSRDPATRDEARTLLERIQRLMNGSPQLPSLLKKQYQLVRQTLASSL
ncbi:MAG TPA: hypothetical protein VG326_17470 [Tepidisphaeraceae bacterium]|jgi:tetratricopeptide (TPR) repeat protein|nr:hypothetical protein [Tepidisphaeraceae bacterium]